MGLTCRQEAFAPEAVWRRDSLESGSLGSDPGRAV